MAQPPAVPPPEPRDPKLRIGNPEREAVIAQLTAALNEGRLELTEYDDRVRQVYAARTAGELVPITADLPAPAPPVPPRQRRDLRSVLTPDELRWAGVAVILTVIWLVQVIATQELGYFWPIWPIGIWGAVLLARRIHG